MVNKAFWNGQNGLCGRFFLRISRIACRKGRHLLQDGGQGSAHNVLGELFYVPRHRETSMPSRSSSVTMSCGEPQCPKDMKLQIV